MNWLIDVIIAYLGVIVGWALGMLAIWLFTKRRQQQMHRRIKNKKWYFAYSIHRWPTTEDIINKPFCSFKKAFKEGEKWLTDDDAIEVYYRYDNKWWKQVRWE